MDRFDTVLRALVLLGFVKLFENRWVKIQCCIHPTARWDEVIGVAIATSGTDMYAEFLKYSIALSFRVRCD
jgi:hypothetical protein